MEDFSNVAYGSVRGREWEGSSWYKVQQTPGFLPPQTSSFFCEQSNPERVLRSIGFVADCGAEEMRFSLLTRMLLGAVTLPGTKR